jgi:hypothetical protein
MRDAPVVVPGADPFDDATLAHASMRSSPIASRRLAS